jgi:hypothetical protein
MAENDDPTPLPGEPPAEVVPVEETAEQTVVTTDPAPAASDTPRFTERLWNFRAMVAVALAALLLGGGLGAAIAAVSHDDGPDRHGRFARFGDGPPGPFTGPGGPHGFAPGQRQQLRDDLKQMRKRLKQERESNPSTTPTPSPATPSPTTSG